MAVNKAKRSIHLTQPHPEPAELMPVRAHAYRTMAEMNTGFEQTIQSLQTLEKISFLSLGGLGAIHNQLSRIRAQANRQLMAIFNDRETANADHFQRLCPQLENDAPANR